MKNVFQFPKAKPQKEQANSEKPTRCEVINIADRTPDYALLLNDLNVDAWPFCAA